MDHVFIEGLEIEALIGIYDWERRVRQTLVFDLEMAFDNRVPAASDDIAHTLDYKAVSTRIREYVAQSGFGLVETLAAGTRLSKAISRSNTSVCRTRRSQS